MAAAKRDGAGLHDLSGVLDVLIEMCQRHDGGRIHVRDILHAMGERSFGPVLLVPAVIALSPATALPAVPVTMAAIIVIVCGQIMLGLRHIWLPQFLSRQSIDAARLLKPLKWLRRYARYVDLLLRPRLIFLTRGLFLRLLALACMLVAIAMPIIKILPLAGIIPNTALTAYALAITARDGLWALLAFAFTAGAVWLVWMVLA
jgi:hypothetical protein